MSNGADLFQATNAVVLQLPSFAQLAGSALVLDLVADELGPDYHVDGLSKEVRTESSKETTLISIVVRDGKPQRAADIANAVSRTLKAVIEDSGRIDGAASPFRVTVVDRATAPPSASSPNLVLNLLLGTVLGLLAGTCSALARDALDRHSQSFGRPLPGSVRTDNALAVHSAAEGERSGGKDDARVDPVAVEPGG